MFHRVHRSSNWEYEKGSHLPQMPGYRVVGHHFSQITYHQGFLILFWNFVRFPIVHGLVIIKFLYLRLLRLILLIWSKSHYFVLIDTIVHHSIWHTITKWPPDVWIDWHQRPGCSNIDLHIYFLLYSRLLCCIFFLQVHPQIQQNLFKIV